MNAKAHRAAEMYHAANYHTSPQNIKVTQWARFMGRWRMQLKIRHQIMLRCACGVSAGHERMRTTPSSARALKLALPSVFSTTHGARDTCLTKIYYLSTRPRVGTGAAQLWRQQCFGNTPVVWAIQPRLAEQAHNQQMLPPPDGTKGHGK